MMPTNGQPNMPPVPTEGKPQRRQEPRRSAQLLHPEAESLAYGYSDLLLELDAARAKIGDLQRQLENERRYRIYWQNFVRQVAEAGTRMLQDSYDG